MPMRHPLAYFTACGALALIVAAQGIVQPSPHIDLDNGGSSESPDRIDSVNQANHSTPPIPQHNDSQVSHSGGARTSTVSVSNTVDLLNDSVISGASSASNILSPTSISFNSAQQLLYVTDNYSGNLTTLNLSSGTIRTVPINSSYPSMCDVSYAPQTGLTYILSNGVCGGGTSSNAEILFLANNDSVKATFQFQNPAAVTSAPVYSGTSTVFDRSNQVVYTPAANGTTAEVIGLNGTTGKLVCVLPLTFEPTELALDPSDNLLYATGTMVNYAAVLNLSTQTEIGTIPVGDGPNAIIYDPVDGYMYVANYDSMNLTIINANAVEGVGEVSLQGNPIALSFDSHSNTILALDNEGNLYMIAGNNSSINYRFELPSIFGPDYITSSGANGTIYVLNEEAANLTEINASTGTVYGSIQLGYEPGAMVIDTLDGNVFLANEKSCDLLELDGGSGRVIETFSIGSFPDPPGGLAFDPVNDLLFVSLSNPGRVLEVDPLTGHVIGTINLGVSPESLAMDVAQDLLFVADTGLDTLIEIDASTGQILQSTPVGEGPDAIAVDTTNNLVFVSDRFSNEISVVNITSFETTELQVGSEPVGIVYDEPEATVFFAAIRAPGGYAVSEINPITNTVSDSIPLGLESVSASALDTVTNEMLLVGINATGFLAIINATNASVAQQDLPVGLSPDFVVFDPVNAKAYVANFLSGSLTVLSGGLQTFPVNFTEQGLPNGTTWSIVVDGTYWSTLLTHIGMVEPNGTSSYEVSGEAGWTTTSYSGLFSVAGSPTHILLPWTRIDYSIGIVESGLPNGTAWGVAITPANHIETDNSSLTLQEPNGTYLLLITVVPGWRPSPVSENVVVAGFSQTVSVVWARVTYNVQVSETQLPLGVEWWFNLTDSQVSVPSDTAAVLVEVPNGTFNYTAEPILKTYRSHTGNFTIDGSDIVLKLAFPLVVYNITFIPRGLPLGQNWSVTLDDASHTNDGDIEFRGLENGSHMYSVSPLPGFSEDPSSGQINVNGSSMQVYVSLTSVRSVMMGGFIQSLDYLAVGVAILSLTAGVILWRWRVPPKANGAGDSTVSYS